MERRDGLAVSSIATREKKRQDRRSWTLAQTYEGSPVPLPGAAWLFVSGHGGLGAMKRSDG